MTWKDNIKKNNTDFGIGISGKSENLNQATTELYRIVAHGKMDYRPKLKEVLDRVKDLEDYAAKYEKQRLKGD